MSDEQNESQELAPTGHGQVVDSFRHVAEIKSRVELAKSFPRDMIQFDTQIMTQCSRLDFAEKAIYAFPRSGQTISGLSVGVAKAIAQAWRNIEYGVRELERKATSSTVQAFAWDLESNVREYRDFEVPHFIELKGKIKKRLSDPRDIYELCQNQGARRMRECILDLIPHEIKEAIKAKIKATQLANNKQTKLSDRVKALVLAFKEQGVSQEMLEAKLGHKLDLITEDEFLDLATVGRTIREKQGKREDFFEFPDDTKSDFSERLRSKREGATDAETV